MKVRHKQTGRIREVERTLSCIGNASRESLVYLFKDDPDVVDRVEHYEPVPELKWVDVTAECEVYGENRIAHAGHAIHGESVYRLRKVKRFHQIPGSFTREFDVFVVEKQEPA